MPDIVFDVIGAILLLGGSTLTLVSAIGMVRYSDLLSRQHVATKPQVMSLIFALVGVMFLVRDPAMTWTLLLVIAFQLVTSPISAHMISRAGYRTGRVRRSDLVVDELGADLDAGNDDGR